MFGKHLKKLLGRRGQGESELAQALRRYAAGDHAAAEVLCERCLTKPPRDTDALCLLALCREGLNEQASAQEAWMQVLELNPAHAEALCAIGDPARATGLARGAVETEESFEQRLRIAREMVSFWAHQDRLWRCGLGRDPRIPLPVWDGGPLAGKRILLHSMRGFGDTINFARFASELAERGALVRLECGRPLHRLLASCPGVSELVETGALDAASGCDLHAPLVVLLKHFFFAELARNRGAYLTADRDDLKAWKEKFANSNCLRVGLCWAGNPMNKNDAKRSVALATLETLLKVPGVLWVSLQKGSASAQLAQFPQAAIEDWTNELSDFADTAALVANLDLVISVNTAVAHLAGALGKPVWILYSGNEDRRWEVVNEPGCLYSQARLFRQSKPGDWCDPVNLAAAALNNEIQRHSRAVS